MSEQVYDRDRRVVPRWRPFRIAAQTGELDPSTLARTPGFPTPAPGEVEALQSDWERHRTPIHAANLVDAALVLGKTELATGAAEWLLSNGAVSSISEELARQVLAPAVPARSSGAQIVTISERHRRIAAYRKLLRQVPGDPLLWVDLGLEHTALGQLEAARTALRTALGLAPDNRFVVRSASRLYLHLRDPEQAHSILLRTPRTRRDPWLLAAEIAAADLRGVPSRLVKSGARMLEAGIFSPRHGSELASAVGTVEYAAGKRRKARRYFESALRDPTENAVAQAAWFARQSAAFALPETSLRVPLAFEAGAWVAARESRFDQAVDLAARWRQDEPFATQPYLFGSWVLSYALGNYSAAAHLAQEGMHTNPGNPRIIANALYCEASAGRVDAAVEWLAKLEDAIRKSPGGRSAPEWEIMLLADRGLIAFRKGDSATGRLQYRAAFALASRAGLPQYGASAFINYMREEVIATRAFRLDERSLDQALTHYPPGTREIVGRFVERIVAAARGVTPLPESRELGDNRGL